MLCAVGSTNFIKYTLLNILGFEPTVSEEQQQNKDQGCENH